MGGISFSTPKYPLLVKYNNELKLENMHILSQMLALKRRVMLDAKERGFNNFRILIFLMISHRYTSAIKLSIEHSERGF